MEQTDGNIDDAFEILTQKPHKSRCSDLEGWLLT